MSDNDLVSTSGSSIMLLGQDEVCVESEEVVGDIVVQKESLNFATSFNGSPCQKKVMPGLDLTVGKDPVRRKMSIFEIKMAGDGSEIWEGPKSDSDLWESEK